MNKFHFAAISFVMFVACMFLSAWLNSNQSVFTVPFTVLSVVFFFAFFAFVISADLYGKYFK